MAENDSSSTMIVAIIAILVIVALGFILFRVLPGTNGGGASDINVEVPLPDGTSGGGQ